MTNAAYWSVVQVEARMLVRPKVRADAPPVYVGASSPAEFVFSRLGNESYFPRTRTRRGGATKIEPLFPGYIFVRIIDDRWYDVRWSVGVVRVLMAGDGPARLADKVVDELRRNESGGFVRLPPPPVEYRPGQPVRIMTGSFRGLVGLYEGQTAQDRERVLLDLLGRMVPVTLERTDRIEAAVR
jgi:transcriptional antiterminator RfaH